MGLCNSIPYLFGLFCFPLRRWAIEYIERSQLSSVLMEASRIFLLASLPLPSVHDSPDILSQNMTHDSDTGLMSAGHDLVGRATDPFKPTYI